MDLYELFALLALGAVSWLWLDGLKAREIGMAAARQSCLEEGFQLLDDTVAGSLMRLARDDEGRLKLRRVFSFEYSDTGDNRRSGSVILLGHQVEMLHVRPNLYVIPQTTTSHETQH